MLQHLYIKELQYMHFQFDYECSVTTYDITFLLLSPSILENTYSMKQPDLYHFEAIKMTSKPYQTSQGILACGSYSPYKI